MMGKVLEIFLLTFSEPYEYSALNLFAISQMRDGGIKVAICRWGYRGR